MSERISPFHRRRPDGDEPPPRGAPQLRPITPRQQVAADLRLQNPTMSQAEIARRAGYSDGDAVKKALSSPQVRHYMAKYLDEAGATMAASARAIAEAHSANELQVVSYKGEVTERIETPDHMTRLKAAELNMKVRGELREGAQINFNLYAELTDEQLAAIAAGQAKPSDFINMRPTGAMGEYVPTP